MDLGPPIKARRNAQGLTLSDLAAKSGVSAAMLCDIEAGKKNPTIRVVAQIASGLGCTISDLLDLPPVVRFQPVRKADYRVLVDPVNGIERRLLSPALVSRGIQVLLYLLPPGVEEERFPPDQPGVVEHITVAKGRVRVHIGDDTVDLEEGDSITYQPNVSHALTNLGPERAEVFIVLDATRAGTPLGLGLAPAPPPG